MLPRNSKVSRKCYVCIGTKSLNLVKDSRDPGPVNQEEKPGPACSARQRAAFEAQTRAATVLRRSRECF